MQKHTATITTTPTSTERTVVEFTAPERMKTTAALTKVARKAVEAELGHGDFLVVGIDVEPRGVV